MTDEMAITGVLIQFKPMVQSGCLRAIVEFQPEMADEALRRLGGLVKPEESRHVALAILKAVE